MFKICDGNVECYIKQGNSFTLGSGWKIGDVIHNISNNSSIYIDPNNLN